MLPRIERYVSKKFGFDATYTFRGGFWLLLGHFFTIFAILTTSYVFANFLSPDLYGNYRYLVSATTVIALFSLTGLHAAVTQATAKGVHFFTKAFHLSLHYGLITSGIALLGGLYYLHNDNILLGYGFLFISLMQPFINAFELISAYQIGRQAFKRNTHWHLVKTVITSTSIVAATVLTNEPLLIFLVFLTSNALASGIATYFNKPVEESASAIEIKPYVKYAKHTSIQNIVGGFADQLDKLLIFQNLGAKELAVYAFATAIPDQYKGITKTIDMLILPRFSRHKAETIHGKIIHKSLIYFLLLSICAALYYFIAPFIFAWLYPTYSETVWLSQLYALGIIFGFGSIPLNALKATMDSKILHKFRIVTAFFQVVTLIILVHVYGLLGAIITRILFRAFICFYGYYLYLRKRRTL